MKFCLLIDSLGSGGAQNQITLLAQELKKEGHNVFVVTYYKYEFYNYRLSENNIPNLLLEKKDKIGFSVIRGIIKLINGRKPDCIISFLDTPNFYACCAKLACKHKAKLIISYRSKTDFIHVSKMELLRKRCLNFVADKIVSNSFHEKERWTQRYPSLSRKWNTIYNIVDHSRFYESNEGKRNNLTSCGECWSCEKTESL